MEYEKNENLSSNQMKPSSLNYESWLKTEFEQNFDHLRDRDSKFIEIIKFYATLVLGVVTASIALMGIKNLNHAFALVGLLLIATCFVGEICLLWMIAFRRYFVTSARQVNAIRHLYAENIPGEYQGCVLQSTDPSQPPLLHKGSAHITMMRIITFVNATLATIGTLGIMSYVTQIKSWQRISVIIAIFLIVITVNTLYIRKKLKEKKED